MNKKFTVFTLFFVLLFSFVSGQETKIYGKYCIFAEKIGEVLNSIASKKLPLNVDGAMGAIISDMGFDFRLAKGFFIIGRVPGLVAHIYEEIIQDEGLRRLSEDAVEYIGQAERVLPNDLKIEK